MSERIRLFSPENRVALLSMNVDKPTGIVCELGGLCVDLLPLTTREGSEMFAVIKMVGAMWASLQEGKGEITITQAIGDKGPEILGMVRDYLARCCNVQEGDEESFQAWFDRLPLVQTLIALLPKLIAANKLGDLFEASDRPTVAEGAAK